MKALAYVGAVAVFLAIYVVSVVVSGFMVAGSLDFLNSINPQQNEWWFTNGTPFVVYILAGYLGALIASHAVVVLFKSIKLMPVVLTFAALLIVMWIATGLSVLLGHPGQIGYAYGAVMALTAAITAIRQGARHWRP